MVDLKIFLSLAMPDQYCLARHHKENNYIADFGVIFWGKNLLPA